MPIYGRALIARLCVCFVLMVSWLSAPSALKLDLDLISCRELLGTNRQNLIYLVVWLRGFWTEADEPMILDLERLQADADRVTDFCTRNPDTKAFAAANQIFQ